MKGSNTMTLEQLTDYLRSTAAKKHAEAKSQRVDYCRGLAAGQAIAFELTAEWITEAAK